jgi:hypothetical protein
MDSVCGGGSFVVSDNSNVITSYKIEFDSGKEATVTIEHDLGDDFITDLQDLICGSEKVESVGCVCRGVSVPATSSHVAERLRLSNIAMRKVRAHLSESVNCIAVARLDKAMRLNKECLESSPPATSSDVTISRKYAEELLRGCEAMGWDSTELKAAIEGSDSND